MKVQVRNALNASFWVKPALLLSGLVAVGIAMTILLTPEVFYSTYGIEVAGNATLVNELKAPAGALLVAGLLMLAGVFSAQLTAISLTTAAVVYLAYGVSRILSMVIDGLPNSGMVSAAAIELGIGAMCLLVLLRVRNLNNQYSSIRRQS